MKSENISELIRRPGGFWTGFETPLEEWRESQVPVWYFGAGTIKSLINKNIFEVTKRLPRGDAMIVQLINLEV